jgi:hypothetical protein
MTKPIHVKPAFYAFCYEQLKAIALKYGYNLVLHGSMHRDLDLIAIPWSLELGKVEEMMNEFAVELDGKILPQTEEQRKCFNHGRESWVINLNRCCKMVDEVWTDPQYYIDISVIPIPA